MGSYLSTEEQPESDETYKISRSSSRHAQHNHDVESSGGFAKSRDHSSERGRSQEQHQQAEHSNVSATYISKRTRASSTGASGTTSNVNQTRRNSFTIKILPSNKTTDNTNNNNSSTSNSTVISGDTSNPPTSRRNSLLFFGGRRHSVATSGMQNLEIPGGTGLNAPGIPTSSSTIKIMPNLPPPSRKSRNTRDECTIIGSNDHTDGAGFGMDGPVRPRSWDRDQLCIDTQPTHQGLSVVIPPPPVSKEWNDAVSLHNTTTNNTNPKPPLQQPQHANSARGLDSAIGDISNVAFFDLNLPRAPLTTKIVVPPPIPRRGSAIPETPVSAIPKSPPRGNVPRAGTASLAKITKFNSCTSLFVDATLVSADLHETLRSASILIVNLINQKHDEIITEDILSEERHPLSRHIQFYTRKPSEEDVYKFLECIFHAAELTVECAIITVVYVERLLEVTGVTLYRNNWARIVLGGLILASKVWDDHAVWNVDFCQIFPDVDVRDLNDLERYYMTSISFNVNVKGSIYAKTYFDLRQIAESSGRIWPLRPLLMRDIEAPGSTGSHSPRNKTDTPTTANGAAGAVKANPRTRELTGGKAYVRRSASDYFLKHAPVPASVM
ncbi:hypothetical protein SmJEL517_g00794 [Synchytrium microbalum]|uniref:Cyclin-like domain-containing protein n=1 Tax=Synchytrium microbalum TaxID=1806994 RepID=A0A507CDD0_9FUNG|nr:uncharacterized protein SmJEL517_g00794 [Synchytrium microbalum]TPX37179.1 hypothetical protein SmJEL517_g00794 [Synchytrium microbalum]